MRRIQNYDEAKAPQMKKSNPKITKLVDTIVSDLGVLVNLVESDPSNRPKATRIKGVLTSMKKLQGVHWSS